MKKTKVEPHNIKNQPSKKINGNGMEDVYYMTHDVYEMCIFFLFTHGGILTYVLFFDHW
jgi:hypothetical protein